MQIIKFSPGLDVETRSRGTERALDYVVARALSFNGVVVMKLQDRSVGQHDRRFEEQLILRRAWVWLLPGPLTKKRRRQHAS